MATFDADLARLVALEVKERTLSLYAALLPLQASVSGWVLNGTDPMLPAPFDIRVGVEQYQALKIERLRLDAWIELLLTAQVGDELVYPPPPIAATTGLADGSALADGATLADGNG